MMRVKSGLIAVAFCFAMLSAPAQSQGAAPVAASSAPGEVLAIEERVMASVLERGQPRVMSVIAETSPILSRQLAANPQTQSQVTAVIDLYGQPSRWELVDESIVGTSIISRIYAVEHDQAVIMWRITYMRTSRGWAIGSFVFNDQIDNWIIAIERNR